MVTPGTGSDRVLVASYRSLPFIFMNHYLTPDEVVAYTDLASEARYIEDRLSGLTLHTMQAGIPELVKLEILYWIQRAETFRGLSYFLTPQSEWQGDENWKTRAPNIAFHAQNRARKERTKPPVEEEEAQVTVPVSGDPRDERIAELEAKLELARSLLMYASDGALEICGNSYVNACTEQWLEHAASLGAYNPEGPFIGKKETVRELNSNWIDQQGGIPDWPDPPGYRARMEKQG